MSIKSESLQLLADTIAPEVYAHISEDEVYISGLMNALPYAIREVLGEVSPDLIGELGVLIMEQIAVPNTKDLDSAWEKRYKALYAYVKTNFAADYIDGAEYGNVNIYYNGDN